MEENELTEQINWLNLLHAHNIFSHLDAMEMNNIAR